MGSHDQRGQNRPPAANQMLTKHLTGCLTENAHRNKTAGKHRRPTRPFEPSAPATTETAEHHSSRRRRMGTRASTNEQTGRKPARSVPECRHIRNVPSCRHLGTFLMCRPLGTALVDSIVGSRLTAPAPRRPRLRRPGHRPWRSPQASCRCGRHRPRTPVRHPRRRRRHGPQDENPRQPSRATDDPP